MGASATRLVGPPFRGVLAIVCTLVVFRSNGFGIQRICLRMVFERIPTGNQPFAECVDGMAWQRHELCLLLLINKVANEQRHLSEQQGGSLTLTAGTWLSRMCHHQPLSGSNSLT